MSVKLPPVAAGATATGAEKPGAASLQKLSAAIENPGADEQRGWRQSAAEMLRGILEEHKNDPEGAAFVGKQLELLKGGLLPLTPSQAQRIDTGELVDLKHGAWTP